MDRQTVTLERLASSQDSAEVLKDLWHAFHDESSTSSTGLAQEVGWQVFPEVVAHLRHGVPDATFQMAEEVLGFLVTVCNAKECFTQIMEAFTTNVDDTQTRLVLLDLVTKVFMRLETKQGLFLHSALPTLLDLPFRRAEDGGEVFLTPLVHLVVSLVPEPLSTEAERPLIESILTLVVQLLAHPALATDSRQVEALQLIKCLLDCPVDPVALLRRALDPPSHTKDTTYHDSEEDEDEEDESSPSPLISDDVCLDPLGLGILAHQLVSLFPSSIPSVLTPSFRMRLVAALVVPLFQGGNDVHSNCAIALLRWGVDLVPLEALSVGDVPSDGFMPMLNSLTAFMVMCPDPSTRLLAARILNRFISSFDARVRSEMLHAIVSTCSFPQVVELLVRRVKDEIDSAWGAENFAASPFGRTALRWVHTLYPQIQEIEKAPEVTLAVLNLHRFLLLRDKKANCLGAWDDKELSWARNTYLKPLQTRLTEAIATREADLGTQVHAPVDDTADQAFNPLTMEKLGTLQRLYWIGEVMDRLWELVGQTEEEGDSR